MYIKWFVLKLVDAYLTDEKQSPSFHIDSLTNQTQFTQCYKYNPTKSDVKKGRVWYDIAIMFLQ